MSQTFPTCKPLQSQSDGLNLINWVQNALVYMVELVCRRPPYVASVIAMLTCFLQDYDEASNYGIQFPAWPVNRT